MRGSERETLAMSSKVLICLAISSKSSLPAATRIEFVIGSAENWRLRLVLSFSAITCRSSPTIVFASAFSSGMI
ncbi:MAG: hypothetical protein CHACPFDD_03344 [Phycisphaerae bacterium]|nr:hypothetical protein [Phycisphaerae bacterium]